MSFKKPLTAKECTELYENYSKTNAIILEKAKNKEDARNVWFSIKEIQEYIAHLRGEFSEKEFETLGISIYLGAYGKNSDLDGKDVSEYQTVFLYPNQIDEDALKSNKVEDDKGYNRGRLSPPY